MILSLDKRRALVRRGAAPETLTMLAAEFQQVVEQGVGRLLQGETVSEWERGRLAMLSELAVELSELARDARRPSSYESSDESSNDPRDSTLPLFSGAHY